MKDKEKYTKEEHEQILEEALVAYEAYRDSVREYHNVLSCSSELTEKDSKRLLTNTQKTISKNVEECRSIMPKSLFNLLNIA